MERQLHMGGQRRRADQRGQMMPEGMVGLGIGLAVGVGLAITLAAMSQKRAAQDLPPDSAPDQSARRPQGSARVVSAAVTVRGTPEEVKAAAETAGLSGAMIGDASATLQKSEREPEDVLAWQSEDGQTLVKLEFRPARGGSMTAVTGIVGIEGGRVASAVRSVLGHGPEVALKTAMSEFRMRLEAGEVARAR